MRGDTPKTPAESASIFHEQWPALVCLMSFFTNLQHLQYVANVDHKCAESAHIGSIERQLEGFSGT